jgi:hypothetical protein
MDGSALNDEIAPLEARAQALAEGRLLGIDPDHHQAFGSQEIQQPIKRCLERFERTPSPVNQCDIVLSSCPAEVCG